MLYQIELLESAKRELKKLPKEVAKRILSKITALQNNPKPQGCKKLKSFDVPNNPYNALYRIRIGDYRVIYAIEAGAFIVVIVKVANRKEVYE